MKIDTLLKVSDRFNVISIKILATKKENKTNNKNSKSNTKTLNKAKAIQIKECNTGICQDYKVKWQIISCLCHPVKESIPIREQAKEKGLS